MKLEEIDHELNLEDLKIKFNIGAKIIVSSNYAHTHRLNSPHGFDVQKDEEGQIVEIIEEDDCAYRYFIDEAMVKPSILPPIGKYRFKVDFVGRIGEYSWNLLRDPGYAILRDPLKLRVFHYLPPEAEEDPKIIEKIFRLKAIIYPENPRQLHLPFNFLS